jgi:lysozyme
MHGSVEEATSERCRLLHLGAAERLANRTGAAASLEYQAEGPAMKTSDGGLQLIKESEGLRLTPYQDSVGVWTDGYGNTHGVVSNVSITETKAIMDLLRNVSVSESIVASQITVPLTQGQFDALVDFVFNLGQGALSGSTLRRKLNSGDYAGAAAEFPKWCHAGNEVLPGLVTRRAKERAMFEGDGNGA